MRAYRPKKFSPKIRLRVAGLYIENGNILLVKHRKYGREYYLLPGGGQEAGETAKDSLRREWREELGLDIGVGDLLFTGESVPPVGTPKSQVFQLAFSVEKIYGEIQTLPDGALIGWEWIPIDQFEKISFFPACKEQVLAVIRGERPVLYKRYDWIR
ncbi:MAG: NUDIX domain-containing protein [Candidatus Hydrogenedentota bacterium]|nr:MAG: NUDIX domain-containing protein [Candidatus Hydrogenedentota bacterium]